MVAAPVGSSLSDVIAEVLQSRLVCHVDLKLFFCQLDGCMLRNAYHRHHYGGLTITIRFIAFSCACVYGQASIRVWASFLLLCDVISGYVRLSHIVLCHVVYR